jgi:hypothetical protein
MMQSRNVRRLEINSLNVVCFGFFQLVDFVPAERPIVVGFEMLWL